MLVQKAPKSMLGPNTATRKVKNSSSSHDLADQLGKPNKNKTSLVRFPVSRVEVKRKGLLTFLTFLLLLVPCRFNSPLPFGDGSNAASCAARLS